MLFLHVLNSVVKIIHGRSTYKDSFVKNWTQGIDVFVHLLHMTFKCNILKISILWIYSKTKLSWQQHKRKYLLFSESSQCLGQSHCHINGLHIAFYRDIFLWCKMFFSRTTSLNFYLHVSNTSGISDLQHHCSLSHYGLIYSWLHYSYNWAPFRWFPLLMRLCNIS